MAKVDGKIASIEEKLIKQKNNEGKEIIYPPGEKNKIIKEKINKEGSWTDIHKDFSKKHKRKSY